MLTSPSKVRQFALDQAPKLRSHKFTRVSKDFLEAIESEVRMAITRRIQSQPSVGETLK